jgi:anti-sigma factor RsiW
MRVVPVASATGGGPNMISCNDVMDRLANLLGGYLPPESRELLEQHLAGCAACRDYLETCRLEAHIGSALPLPRPPAHLKAVLEEEGGE